VIGLDILDQIGVEPSVAVAEIRRVLAPGGWLLARVSAYPSLYGPHDRAFGTARRYTRDELHAMLLDGGLEPHRISHANSLLLPAAALSRLAQKRNLLPAASSLAAPHWLNRPFTRVLAWEASWLRKRNLAWGLSLYVLARRPTAPPS
jgi:hypothetical protein